MCRFRVTHLYFLILSHVKIESYLYIAIVFYCFCICILYRGERRRRRMSALKKKDYYQFCYDENEKEASFDDNDDDDDDIDQEDESESESDIETYDFQEHQNGSFVTPTSSNAPDPVHVDTPYYHPHSEEVDNSGHSEEQDFSYHLTPTIHNNKNVKKQRPHLSLLFDEEQMMMVDNMFDQTPSPSSSSVNSSNASNSDGIGSPSSMESFTIDGYVIEIDEETNTININASPSSYSDPVVCYSPHYDMLLNDDKTQRKRFSTGGNHLSVPSSFSDDLSSSGVSLNDEFNSSPLSSAPSLTTEIDRLRNLNSLICDLDSSNSSSPTAAMMTSLGGMNKRRAGSGDDRYFRRISGSSTASDSVAMFGKSSKSLESLKSRSSTADSRKSPFGFIFRPKNKMTPAKSDCELSRIKKSSSSHRKSSKKSKENNSSSSSIFRLKRSNSVSLKQKYRLSKGSFTKSEQQIWNNGRLATDNSASSELILQQPSPFVRTIFQFVATDEDEMFPPASSFENLTTLPIYTCTRSCKLFMDFNKSNSLSRRHKHKNNLSTVVRTISQDAHEPVLLSTGRRICEMSEFFIAVISYLDRIRKAKEIVEDTSTQARLPQQPQSNRFERLSLRKSYLLPLTLHERFSKQFDNTSFNQDLILTGVNNSSKKKSNSANKTQSSNKLVSSTDDLLSAGGFLNRSKSLRNISFGSLRRKSKQAKQKGATTTQDENVISTTTMGQDMTTSSNESRGCTSENATHKDEDNIRVRTNNKSTCCCQLQQLAMTSVEGAEESGEERKTNVLKENTSPNNIIIACNSTSCEGCGCNHNCGSTDQNQRKASKTLATNNSDNKSSKSASSKQNTKRRGKDEVKNNVCGNCSSALLNIPATNNLSTDTQQKYQHRQQAASNTNSKASAVLEQTSEKNHQSSTTTIRYLAGKLKKINNKRNKIPDVEYLTKSDKPKTNEHQASPPPPGVDRLRQQFEGSSPSSPEMDQRASSPEITVDVPQNAVAKEKKRSGGGLRRSLSWRLKRDKGNKSDKNSDTSGDVKNNVSPQQMPKIKEKTDKPNKFSSIRSMFEPLSPSEKKKFSVEQMHHNIHNRINSPVRHRKSNKSAVGRSSKTETVVSLRYSRINGDDIDSSEPSSPYHSNSSSVVNSPPSSPDVTIDLTRRAASSNGVTSAESGEAISSELYTSSDSSPISPNVATSSQQKKGFQFIVRSQVC